MHKSSFEKMRWFKNNYLEEDCYLDILDVGSLDTSGDNYNYKSLFENIKWNYTGLDFENGDNVDILVEDIYNMAEINDNSYDVVVEATGSVSGFETSLGLVKPRGVLVLKSTIATGKELNLAPIVINEITVLGSRCGQFGPALNLLKNKRIDFKPFISKTYSADDAVEAFEANKAKDTVKILLKFS